MKLLDQVILFALAIPFGISGIACAINLQLALARTKYNKYLLMLIGPTCFLFPGLFLPDGDQYRRRTIHFGCMALICGLLAWLYFLWLAER